MASAFDRVASQPDIGQGGRRKVARLRLRIDIASIDCGAAIARKFFSDKKNRRREEHARQMKVAVIVATEKSQPRPQGSLNDNRPRSVALVPPDSIGLGVVHDMMLQSERAWSRFRRT
jgi:hypothetical protein